MLDLSASAGILLTLAQQQVGAKPVISQVATDIGQRMGVDDAGPQLGQIPLGPVGMPVVELLGDRQPEHGVAEELQALVGGQAAVLVGDSCGG